MLAILEPEQRVGGCWIAMGTEARCARSAIPDMDAAIFTQRGDLFPVGRPGDDADPVRMSIRRREQFPFAQVPDMNGAILSCGGNLAAVW